MAFLGAAPFFTAWLFLIRYYFFLYLYTAKPAYGWLWGFFNPCVFFFTTGRRKELKRRILVLKLFLILLVIIQIIYIYLLHAHYSQQDIFLQLISLLGDLKCS